jgi:hypothetical protein
VSDTGWKNPAATGETYNDWTNPTYAYTNNGIYATSADESADNQQDFYNFGLAVHQDATIDGIEVSIKAKPVGYKNPNFRVRLSYDGGSNWTTSYYTGSYYSERYKSVGGSSDTWGRSWSPAPLSEFDNTNFRVYVENTGDGGDAYACCDHIQVKVYYTLYSSSSSSISVSVTKTSSSCSSLSATKSSSSISSSSVSGSKSISKSVSLSVSVTKSSVSITVSSSSISSSSLSVSATKSSVSSSSVSVCSSWLVRDIGTTVLNLTWGARSLNFSNLEVDSVKIITNKNIDVQRLQNRRPLIYELGESWKTIVVTLNPSRSPMTLQKLESLRTVTDIFTLSMYYPDSTLAEQFDVRIDPTAKSFYRSGNQDAETDLEMVFYEADAG